MFVTTHYLEEAEFCNNIILINAGNLIAEGSSKELKTNYLKNDLYEIECSQIVYAMEILEKESFVDETSIFGNNIHVSVNKAFESEEQILNVLSNQHSIDVKKINKIVPTLEDVFIHLLEQDKS